MGAHKGFLADRMLIQSLLSGEIEVGSNLYHEVLLQAADSIKGLVTKMQSLLASTVLNIIKDGAGGNWSKGRMTKLSSSEDKADSAAGKATRREGPQLGAPPRRAGPAAPRRRGCLRRSAAMGPAWSKPPPLPRQKAAIS